MKEPPENIKVRLLFVLHRGLVEARLLADANRTKQISDLADALELLPGLLKDWHEGALEQVQSLLRTYQNKYPNQGFDFLSRLSEQDPLAF